MLTESWVMGLALRLGNDGLGTVGLNTFVLLRLGGTNTGTDGIGSMAHGTLHISGHAPAANKRCGIPPRRQTVRDAFVV